MKINLNKNLLDLEGNEIKDAHIGKVVASALAGSNKGDAIKFWHWSTKFYSCEEVELDPSDLETLRTFIKESEQMTVLSKAQILQLL